MVSMHFFPGSSLAAKLRHLLLATLEDTSDPLAWSGSALEIRRALAGAVEQLTVLDCLKVHRQPLHGALRLMLGRHRNREPRYPLWMTAPALRNFARKTAQAIERDRPQAVLSISSQCLVYLHEFYKGPPIPTFFCSDSAWMAWLEVYHGYWPKPLGARRYAARERATAQRITGTIFASDWAQADGAQRYRVPLSTVHVQPFGAGWVPEETEDEIVAAVKARPKDRLQLLFVAKEWERKGGPLALEIARRLQQSGAVGEVCLHIVGVRPEIAPEDERLVQMHGFLRRGVPAEASLLRSLLLESHFLVVPTIAECYGLVFAEAQAFALPPVSRAVHALPSVILDGKTGLLQPIADGAEPYVQRMLEVLAGDRSRYAEMALAGRAYYRDRLNWKTFGTGVAATIEQALTT